MKSTSGTAESLADLVLETTEDTQVGSKATFFKNEGLPVHKQSRGSAEQYHQHNVETDEMRWLAPQQLQRAEWRNCSYKTIQRIAEIERTKLKTGQTY